MIDHERRFIFLHIPRTGGTSVETLLRGGDLWRDRPDEKHLSASEARRLYGADAWDRYFTFTFVRNPWDRMVSLWKSRYYAQAPTLREFLVRYRPRPHEPSSPRYADILDLNVDFVGRYERLQQDFDLVCDRIGIPRAVLPRVEVREHEHYSRYYDGASRAIVAHVHAEDIRRYGYAYADERGGAAAPTPLDGWHVAAYRTRRWAHRLKAALTGGGRP